MKVKYFLPAMLLSVALLSCRKGPSVSDFDGEFMVYTARNQEVEFSSFKTFTVADSLLYVESNRGRMALDGWVKSVRSQYIKLMTDRGFVYVDTGMDDNAPGTQLPGNPKADLGIQISYIVSTDYFTSHVSVNPDYWWGSYPGYWYPGYWGAWGGWHYAFPVTYSYSVQSLLTEMVDLTSVQGKDKPLSVVWNSYIDGSVGNAYMDRARFERAVNQSFKQSEYIVAEGK